MSTSHPPPAPSPKKPPQKKRHTKPCRYFQTGSCPHAAQEDCDFAHVISDGPPPAVPKQCRYYLQGSCTNGIWCQYLHGEAAPQEISLIKEPHTVNSLSIPGFSGLGPASPTVYVPSSPLLYAPWSPYSDSFYSSLEFTPPAHLLPKSGFFSPSVSPDSLETETPASSPTISDHEHDYEVFLPVEDGASHHHNSNYFALQQPYAAAYAAADDTSAFSPPMSPFLGFTPAVRPQLSVVPPPYGMATSQLYDIFSPKSAGFPASVRAAPSAHRQKAPNYRTKPCKFFKPGSICPSGDECTFIHAAPRDKTTTDDSSVESPTAAAPPEHGLPAKPVSKKEDNARKGFFPISWRVIGGGVRLSGSSTSSSGKEFSDIYDFSSDVESESLDEPGQEVDAGTDVDADPLHEASDSTSASSSAPASAPAASVAFPKDPDASEDDASTSESSGATPTSRRRASSIPSALMASHVDVLRLFSSAESPGGL